MEIAQHLAWGWQDAARSAQRVRAAASAPQPERGVRSCAQGLGAGICSLESQPRKQADGG